MNHIGITVVSVAFWLFLGAAAVAGIVQESRKRKVALELLRAAVEHGQQLSPEVIDRLLGKDEHSNELNPRDLHIGGIITAACGVGIALLSAFVALVWPPYHWLVLGVGILGICIGVGLLLAAKSLRR
jgi:amino acid transporter